MPELTANPRQPDGNGRVAAQSRGIVAAFIGTVLIVPLLAFTVIRVEDPHIRREAQSDLAVVARLKADQIAAWLTERRGDAEVLKVSAGFIEDAERWFEHADRGAAEHITHHLGAMGHAYAYQIELLDARADPAGLSPIRRAQMAAALATGEVQMSNLYRDGHGRVWLDMVVPLVKPAAGGYKALGAVVLGAPVGDYLFPLMQTWPTSSPTAEALLLQRDGNDVLYLNNLRHLDDTALKLRQPIATPDLPAAIAARKGGVVPAMEGRDYRGVAVLASSRPVPGTTWIVLAKVDLDEVLQPLRSLVMWITVVSLGAFASLATALLLLWRQQQRAHRLAILAETSQRDRMLRVFYDLPFLGMAIVDPDDGRWLQVNDRLCEILGRTRAEILATSWPALTPEDELGAELALLARVQVGESDGYGLEKRFMLPDRRSVDASVNVRCVRREDGGLLRVVMTVRDITQRKRTEAALRATSAQLALAQRSAGAGMWDWDLTTDRIEWSDELFRLFGLDPAGSPASFALWRSIVHADDREGAETRIRNAVKNRTPLENEYRILLPSGEVRWIYARGSTEQDSTGQPTRMSGICLDITGRKRAETALAESQARLAGVIDSAMDAIITIDTRQRIRLFNPAAERMFGCPASDALAEPIERFIPERHRAEHAERLRLFAATDVTNQAMAAGEEYALRSDGTEFPIEATISQTRVAGEKLLTIILRDVTQRRKAEVALRAERDLNQLYLDTAEAIIVAMDVAGRITMLNRKGCALLGYAPGELDGKNWFDHCLPQRAGRDQVYAVFLRIMAGELDQVEYFENEVLTRSGETRLIAWHNNALRDECGRICGSLSAGEDITERKRAEEALRESEARFRAMADAAPALIWLAGTDRLCTWFNQQWLAFTGRGLDQELGEGWVEVVHPQDRDLTLDIYRESFDRHEPFEIEFRLRRSDGEFRWLLNRGVPHFSPGGQFLGYIGSCVDITSRKLAAAALRASEERLRLALGAAQAGSWDWDLRRDEMNWSPENDLLFGFAADIQPPGHTQWLARIHPEDRERVNQAIQGVVDGRLPEYRVEFRIQHPERGERWLQSLGQVDRGPDGSALRMSGINLDVTERKVAEAALRYQLTLTRNITDKGTDSIFVKDPSGLVTFVNPEAERVFGYAAAELIGQNLHDFIHYRHPDGRPFPLRECHLCQVYASGEVTRDHEAVFYRKDGTAVHVTASNATLESDGKALGAALVLHDITERKQAEAALREREEDLNRAQAVGHIGSWRLDLHRNRLRWSAETHRIFGIPEGSPLTYEAFLDCVHSDDRTYVDRMWLACLAGAPYDIEYRIIVGGKVKWVRAKAELEFDESGVLLGGFGTTQDITDAKNVEQALRDSQARFQLATEIGRYGTWDWDVQTGEAVWSRGQFEILGYAEGEVTPGYQAWTERVHPEDRARVEEEIRLSMTAHRDFAAEYRVVWPDGSIHWLSARGRCEYNDKGVCRGMLGVMADVTPHKVAEMALREADRRKDEFLAMLAHELRNPLAPIRNAAHVLGELQPDEPRVRWAHALIERQVGHLTRLVDDLLDVSRIVRGKINLHVVPISLADVVAEAIESVRGLIDAKRQRLEVRLPEEQITIEGDPVRLTQVLLNLLDNAAKYTPEHGRIDVEARVAGKDLDIRVRDDGLGIPAPLLPKVFDLFQQGERSLDRAQGGLGIGLTLVRRLVEMHGGQVTVSSPGPGQGSTFCVRLPLRSGSGALPTITTPTVASVTARLRILVVDDDSAVADSMAVLLEMKGHDVRVADSGEVALERYAEFHPQCVLLDIGLPGENGYQVARRIRKAPGGKAVMLVAVSGYGHEEAVSRSREAEFDRHLVKPVDPGVLQDVLAEAARRSPEKET